MNHLADQSKWQDIITLIEKIPEAEWDLDIIGRYVRALNNHWELDKAVAVSLRYQALGDNDALWHYRLGYAYLNLSRNDEAEKVLFRAKELAKDDVQVTEWVNELLEQAAEEKEDEAERVDAEAKRRAAYVPRDPNTPPFDGLDLTGFWDDCDYSLNNYVGAPATDEMFAKAEQALGYKLPESYKWLMKQHNGGMVKRDLFRVPFKAVDQPGEIYITGISGVDPAKRYALTGSIGSQFMIGEWGYPDIGVAICDCPSAGHDMIFLDYRTCGPEGEPEVVHIDQESDYVITYLAGDFESFIRGLSQDEDEDNDLNDKNTVALMADYTAIVKYKNNISVCFYIERDKPFAIGKKMGEINDEAYMNGYNWEAFFNYYIPKYAPEIAVGMGTDPEAGMYVAYYDLTPENEAKAEKFVAIIRGLIENEDELYRVVRDEGEHIEWD